MSTLADAMLAWKAKLTTKVTPEQVLTLRSDVNVFVDGVRFLEAENAKLRELVALQSEFAKMPCSPTKCKRYDGYCGFGADAECHYEHEIYDRMVELGIEVKE